MSHPATVRAWQRVLATWCWRPGSRYYFRSSVIEDLKEVVRRLRYGEPRDLVRLGFVQDDGADDQAWRFVHIDKLVAWLQDTGRSHHARAAEAAYTLLQLEGTDG